MSVLVFDLETDGVDPLTAHIVTAYLGLLDSDGRVLMEQEWLIRPDGFEIPQGAIDVHGITNEHAREHGMALKDALWQIVSIIESECLIDGNVKPIVGQNISYDLTLLAQEWGRTLQGSLVPFISRLFVLDTLVLDKRLYKFRRGAGARQLINLAAAYGVHLAEDEAHGARADAIAAGRIALKQVENDALRGMPLDVIHEAQIRWKRDQAEDLEKWFRGKGGKPNEVVDRGWPLHSSLMAQAVAA